MHKWILKSTVLAGLSLVAYSAQTNPLLPAQNLTFSNFGAHPAGCVPKVIFDQSGVLNWTGGTGLISIDAPNTATIHGNCGNAYSVWGAGPNGTGAFPNPPPGGNFIQADGNPTFETSFNQVITGLTPGQQYDLSFWQAAGQQGLPDAPFFGDTTEQWKVFFGSGSFSVNCGVNPCTTSTSGSMQEFDTALMNTPSQGVHPWELVSMTFTADGTSDVLSFLAWGNNGNTTNLPPTVFLAGVNSPALPEPTSMALFGAAFLGFGASWLRKGKRS